MWYYESMKLLTIIGVVLLSHYAYTAVENLRVEVNKDLGTFKVILSDRTWFNSGGVWARNNGRWYTTETLWKHDKLELFGQYTTTGKLDWGPMTTYTFNYKTNGLFYFTTYIVVFEEVPAVIFGQQWDSGGTDTSTGSTNDTISMWPTFKIEDELGLKRGFLTYADNHVRKIVVGSFDSSMDSVYKTMDGGLPVAIFDSKMENTVVISPQNTFMSSHQQVFTPNISKTPIFATGILGSVDTVPKGYSMETLLVAGNNVTGTMEQWGQLLRLRYKKHDHYRLSDFFINYLGYYTDNGACYYYSYGNFSDYDAALLAVKEDAVQRGIPYRYLQLDSWWYYKGVDGGVKNWTAMDSVFPFGIDYIARSTDWPLAAHNRYFSSDTDYAMQNGGQYNFVVNETAGISLPDDVDFWKDLFRNCSNGWNLHVYEQDWLDTVYERLPAVQRELGLGEKWLAKMAYAAEEVGITIQYCMVWPRFVMQSVLFPVVTHARASDDYLATPNNWMIADSTIFFHALGLAAFKDTFHTVTDENFCRFSGNDAEFFPVLETYIAALSGGPVAPSDTVGTADLTLIMATCMDDGLLLKPTRPGMSLDSTFVQRAFGRGGPIGVAEAAYTEVRQLINFCITVHIILHIDLRFDMVLYPDCFE